MLNMTVSLQDIFIFLILILLIVLGAYLILALRNANEVLKYARNILKTNEESIEKLIKPIPVITENLAKATKDAPEVMANMKAITGTIKDGVVKAEEAVDVIGEGIAETVSVVRGSAEDITAYIKIISEVVKIIIGVFSKSK